jgi:uncharacterized protein
MSAAAVIDSVEFARAELRVRGSLLVADLSRLTDSLFDTQGTLDYEVKGGVDELNRPQLAVKVEGPLNLQCQRCLEALQYAVNVSNTLVIVPPGAQPVDEIEDPEAPDTIDADAELDVAALVEDEVLLSLPLAPRHAEGVCQSRLDLHQDDSEPRSAFAQLAALKQASDKR